MVAQPVFKNDTPPDAEYESVDVSGLRAGSRLRMPINDEKSVLLLAEGQTITESFLEKLGNRGISRVRVHRSELPRVYAGIPQGTSREIPGAHAAVPTPERNRGTDHLDESLEDVRNLELPDQEEAFAESLVAHGIEPYDDHAREEFIERQNTNVDQVDQVFAKLLKGDGLDVDCLSSIADEAMAQLQRDIDLFACLGVNPFGGGLPARHSMHTNMLAISIGTHLKLDRQTLKELAIGCLIHDSGMLMIDQTKWRLPRRLSPTEFLEITKHPVRIFDKMLDMRGIPTRSAYIAYQMHERPDGSGYPRQRRDSQIHYLSKVAAVADAYVALVAPRPHRPAVLPHVAIRAILEMEATGRLERSAVHALLRTLSMFPLGSYVQLSDERVATVIRSNDQAYDRPIVEAWRREELSAPSDIVDLQEDQTVSILGALPTLTAPFDPTLGDQNSVQSLMGRFSEPIPEPPGQRQVQSQSRRSFRVNVDGYLPALGGELSSAEWQRTAGVSLEIFPGGLSLAFRSHIVDPWLLVAFEPRPGMRMCFRAEIVRRRHVKDDIWEYAVSFREQTVEPLFTGNRSLATGPSSQPGISW